MFCCGSDRLFVVLEEMLMGHTDGLSERQSSQAHLLADPELEVEEDDDDENGAADNSEEILYEASFEELADNTVKYDTIIWVSISLLLVLAWGVGIFMLLYLPIRRYVLRKDILSRKLYITPSEIVYKVCQDIRKYINDECCYYLPIFKKNLGRGKYHSLFVCVIFL